VHGAKAEISFDTGSIKIDMCFSQQQQQQVLFLALTLVNFNTDTVRPGGGEKTLRSLRLPTANRSSSNNEQVH